MIKIEKSIRREYLWYYAPLILWIVVIFIASSNVGAMSNTSRVFAPILEFLFPTKSAVELVVLHLYIRKAAHFTFYGVLGFLAARAFNRSRNVHVQKNWALAAFALTVAVAAGDEFNQSFLTSRTASVYDVLLDAMGGATMILLFFVARKKFLAKT